MTVMGNRFVRQTVNSVEQTSPNLSVITLDEAISKAPSIGATRASEGLSDSYQFVSTRNVLQNVLDNGWKITEASAQGRSLYAQHRVTLVHENDLSRMNDNSQDGILRMELFNSHNRTRRFMMAIGYFKFACSNGLLVATGPAEAIRTKHRFSDDRLEGIMERISQASERFPRVLEIIEGFRNRQMSNQEQMTFAEYAIKGRYNYRRELPKRVSGDIGRMSNLLLNVRREEDNGNSAWQVFNRVQENMIKGVEGVTRPIRGYTDTVRVNQLLWKGAETTLQFDNDKLNKELMELLIKDGKKGKISA
jgi:hypothetical protein